MTTKTKPGVRLSDRRASFSILCALTVRPRSGLACRRRLYRSQGRTEGFFLRQADSCRFSPARNRGPVADRATAACDATCPPSSIGRPIQRDLRNGCELLQKRLVLPRVEHDVDGAPRPFERRHRRARASRRGGLPSKNRPAGVVTHRPALFARKDDGARAAARSMKLGHLLDAPQLIGELERVERPRHERGYARSRRASDHEKHRRAPRDRPSLDPCA